MNCRAGDCQNTSRAERISTTSPNGDQQVAYTRSDLSVENRERQQGTPEEYPGTSHSLPAFIHAKNEYIWGERPSEEMTPLIEEAYREVMQWKPNLFVPPSGNVANELVEEMTRLILGFAEKMGLERVALTAFFLLPHLVLQLPASRRAAAKRKAMVRRLAMWRAGEITELLEEGRALQERMQANTKKVEWQRGFIRLMLCGRSSAAMRLLRIGSSRGVLLLDEKVEGNTVRSILREKHPDASPMNPDFIEDSPLPRSQHGHSVLFESIDGEAIVKAAMNTQGSAGPSGLDANAWRHLLTGYRPSQKLAEAIASLARRLCTEFVDPKTVTAYCSSRLIPLDKDPGVRPVGIGEVVRRIVGKAALRVITPDLKRVAGKDQLCVGQRAGIESAIHELRTSFNSSNEQCLLQIDADNAFNTLNRSLFLKNIEMICPLMKVLLVNIYRKDSFLPVNGELCYSREGLTQGDNLAMAAFGANTLPLIRRLKQQLGTSILQKWYADDANATGQLPALREFFELLTSVGPNYGYRVNPGKCWLVVQPGNLDEAKRIFEGLPINITDAGHDILGSAIGTDDYVRSFTATKCSDYVGQIERLMAISKEEPHLAYSALVHCLQAQWLHLLRTTPLAAGSLQQVDDAITSRLLPVLLKRSGISNTEREWLALPVRDGGLGINVWSDDELRAQYHASQRMCSPLSSDTEWQECEQQQATIASQIRKERSQQRFQRATRLHAKLNEAQQRAREVAGEKGASAWLHTRPLESQGYHLASNEFYDAVALRMAWTPEDLPSSCQCGADYTVPHALSCQLGGFPIHRHNETRDLLADIMTEACNSVAIEPVLTPVDGRVFQNPSSTTDPNARVDIVAGGVWGGRFDRVYFDVCVFNAFALSNTARSLASTYDFHEKRKVAKYAERIREVEHGSFVPLIFSSSGGCGSLANTFVKRLAFLLAKKRKMMYADAINWLRRRIAFSLLRASSQGLRGARSRLHAPQRPANTSIQATNAITVSQHM